MSQTTVNLGFVPKNRGDWEKNHTSNPDTIYYKDNIIQYRGSAFIYDPDDWDPENPLAVNTTLPPYTDSEGSATEPINGWKVFASDSAYCEQFFSVEENPEYCYVMLDTEQKIVWGIKQDGEPYFGVGCPQQIKDYVEERISSLSLDEYDDIVAFLQDYLGSDTTLKMMMDSLMTATDNQDYYNINKRNVEDTTILVWVANTNWQQIERENADAYDAGDTYRANEVCNIPEDEEHSYKSLAKQKGNYPAKQIEKIIRVDHLTLEEALALVPADTFAKFKAGQVIVFLNTEGNVVKYELQPDGTWKNIFEEITNTLDTKVDKEEGKGLIPLQYIQEISNPEFVRVITDADDKILFGIKADGDICFGVGVPSQIKDYVDGEIEKATPEHYQQVLDFLEGMLGGKTLSEILTEINAEIDTKAAQTDVEALQSSVHSINSRLNKLNLAIDADRGVLRIGNKMFKLIDYTGPADFDEDIDYTIFIEATTTLENPEWQQAITDSEDRLLYGKKQGSGEEYWPQEELEGYTMTVDGVTASVNSIIRNIK